MDPQPWKVLQGPGFGGEHLKHWNVMVECLRYFKAPELCIQLYSRFVLKGAPVYPVINGFLFIQVGESKPPELWC